MNKFIETKWKIKNNIPLEMLKTRGFFCTQGNYKKYGYRELGYYLVLQDSRKIRRMYMYDDALRENPTVEELEELGILDMVERSR